MLLETTAIVACVQITRATSMTNYYSSGATACLLGTTEPRLNGLIRRGKIVPQPELIAGRRAWGALHIALAAHHLGVALPNELLKRAVSEGFEVAHGSEEAV